MTSIKMKEYTRKIIKQYVAERETTPSNDTIMSYPYFLENIIEQVYKDALAEGRECLKNWKNMACFVEWHNIRKNPNDLPERGKEIRIAYHPFLPICQDEDEFEECNGIYKKDEPLWLIDNHIYPTEDIIAWCEIPTYKKLPKNREEVLLRVKIHDKFVFK